MICAEYLAATEIILALMRHDRLPQVVLQAQSPLVEMTINSFALPWRIVRDGGAFTVVRREGN